ncbi:9145_t:CDS:1 [Rhizophagus irregularis]|nr:9145_t:CDS:1 [Rhizophagus irregularis]
MGFGWIFSDINLDIKFSGMTIDWVSSTKAEAFAILTCLITCPLNSNVMIYTDSQCAIDTFNSLSHHKMTPKKFMITHLIDWKYTQLWINYNPFHKVISILLC